MPISTGVTSFSGSATGLTPSTPRTGAVALAGTLDADSGGTGITVVGASGNVLTSNGTAWTSAVPVSSAVNLTGPITSVGAATAIASQTGTGSTFVMSASPTLTGTIAGANQTLSGTLGVTGVATLGNGAILGTPASGNLSSCTGYVGTSALVTVGALNSGSITSGFGAIDVGADAISGGAISGTTLAAAGRLTTTIGTGARGGWDSYVFSSTNAYDDPRWQAFRARGTSASPTTVLTGDSLASWETSGYNGSGGYTYAAGIRVVATGTVSGSNVPTYMAFDVNASSSATEAMRIDSSGNVGIGTSSLTNRLDVVGNFGLNNSNAIKFKNAAGTYQTTVQWDSGDNILIGDSSNSTNSILKFYAGSASGQTLFYGNNTERMRIDSSGNVGIGTSSPASQLQIGTTNAIAGIFEYTFSGNGVCSNNTYASAGGRNDIYFMRAGNNVGRIETSLTATAYYTTSDYRLKDNISPMTGALDKVLQLKPVTYNWKTDNSSGQGFIAHELQSVVPDCVSGEKDGVETYTDEDGNEATRPVHQGIDTSFLVATLTAAIQELKAEFDAYKAAHP